MGKRVIWQTRQSNVSFSLKSKALYCRSLRSHFTCEIFFQCPYPFLHQSPRTVTSALLVRVVGDSREIVWMVVLGKLTTDAVCKCQVALFHGSGRHCIRPAHSLSACSANVCLAYALGSDGSSYWRVSSGVIDMMKILCLGRRSPDAVSCLPVLNGFTLSQWSWERRESCSHRGLDASLCLITSVGQNSYQLPSLFMKGKVIWHFY